MDARLKHPFTCLVAGPTGSGKTWVTHLLQHRNTIIHPVPENWFYGEFQKAYVDISRALPNIRFIEGVPTDFNEYVDIDRTNLFILDDLMTEIKSNQSVTHLFTKGSHHKNFSVIVLLQNLFQQGPKSRTISLNSHYLVVFKNPRDASSITHLAKQMYPGSIRFMQEAYRNATIEPYGYLFIDLKPDTDERLRLRTNIFLTDAHHYVYVKRS
ncbi:hypothetical protein HOLleu_01319 [Holothuria leucospilota]|uniref:Uncharacterized protein n=1 Tax=Holothuria leucospilota TaxID=206669 RepID=A0A9Q1CQA5_HOLLE|nr:hypothetical protein HOLleu_01319 [Holothuria leucospilota]